MSLAFLPDLKTESTTPSGLPNFYRHKPDTAAREIPGYTPRDYLTHWLSQWVRDYGIDGFRVDTAKHVELAAWQQLKPRPPMRWPNGKSEPAEKARRCAVLDDRRVLGHGVMRSDYYNHGFDAMINFDYQEQAAGAVKCLANMDLVWQQMAEKLQGSTR
jgi:alpha-amylase